MDSNLDRRRFIKGAVGGALAGALSSIVDSRKTEAFEPTTFSESTITPELLLSHKEQAQQSLAKEIPEDIRLGHIRKFVGDLKDESQMSIPTKEEVATILQKSEKELSEFGRNLEVGDYGLLAFTDIVDNSPLQKMHVLKRNSPTNIEFVKSYLIAMGDKGFGDDGDSDKTPLGFKSVSAGERGILGQVLSVQNVNKDALFLKLSYKGNPKWFVKGFGSETITNTATEVITDKYVIDARRGIYIHGTNRSGDRDSAGKWKTLLGGKRRSSGCLRMANSDVRDLSLSGYIWTPKSRSQENGKVRKDGTPVLIYATPEAQHFLSLPENQNTGNPGGVRIGDIK